ncbi:Lpg1974 family pore-forming outer membrane protein [Bremerella sp. JC817]|uniref:Lpg1974 family pore-forming outer membrane protein n=1 Tax=Bremerella sp. JC817 TaxID=3231756 RepID=UPI00345791EF
MRYCSFVLICLLGMVSPVHAAETFGELLYWKVTEPVDWVLDTNNLPVYQYINYKSTTYDFSPGFRVGGSLGGDWSPTLAWTHFQTDTEDSATGDLTSAFLGGKDSQPPAPKTYFDSGQIDAQINYDVIDLDGGVPMEIASWLTIRPVIGVRAGIIRQSFHTQFQASYSDAGTPTDVHVIETAESNFWGIGPKVGIENHYALLQTDRCQVDLMAKFYASYLLGHWDVPDLASTNKTQGGSTMTTSQRIQVDERDFSSLAFQAIVGVHWKYSAWSGSIGYELNDWLDQCQIFTDATGPQNNDLLLQGLTANIALEF